MVARLLIVTAVLALGAGCGDDDGVPPGSDGSGSDGGGGGGDAGAIDAARPPSPDGGDAGNPLPDSGEPMRCGNGVVEGSEECDDMNASNDDACLTTCRLACGDGVVNPSERCDTAIAAGMPGACPTACDDGMACTSDALVGTACDVACASSPITLPVAGDGCCPSGATSATDADCPAACGNSLVEMGETCDTGIAAGMPGACPTLASCDDGLPCTRNTLSGSACTAACATETITMAVNGDGCCPVGATSATDNDCSASCGNGVVDSGESCDTAIAAGATGACPAACNDMMVCTTDTLVSGGTCAAVCRFTPIVAPANGDGCCPPGATSITDDDCMPVCGNRVVEMGESCDDGNRTPGDGCDAMCRTEAPPTAFRVNNMWLRDPHAFARVLICIDITDNLNTELANAIRMDGDMPADGLLDLSFVQVFRPLDQAAPTNATDLVFPDCTSPLASAVCTLPAMATRTPALARNRASGTCLPLIAGTTRPYAPAVTVPGAPCYETDESTFTISVGGIPILLTEARIGATYSGVPASMLVNGQMRGFLSEADANATVLPMSLPIVGGMTLASVLRGGMGNCRTGSDMDTSAVTGGRGWYMYFNFTAVTVPYTEL